MRAEEENEEVAVVLGTCPREVISSDEEGKEVGDKRVYVEEEGFFVCHNLNCLALNYEVPQLLNEKIHTWWRTRRSSVGIWWWKTTSVSSSRIWVVMVGISRPTIVGRRS